MKILHVIAEIDPERGGVSQAVRTIISGLNQEGISNEVVSLDAPDAPFLVKDPFRVHALGPSKGKWGYNPRLISWFVKNAPHYTIIILHGLWLYPGYAVHKALQIRKSMHLKETYPRFFVMPHGMLDPWFQRASSRKIKAVRNWAYWKLIESNIVAQADGLLFTCQEELQLAREPFRPYKPKKETVVGLGVDEPPAYTPTMREAFLNKCPDLQDSPYFLFLGRIHEKKGIDLLIKAYNKLINNYLSECRASLTNEPLLSSNSLNQQRIIPKLVIAGPGLETSYGQEMQRLASHPQHLTKCIIFPGMLTGEAKWGAFYGCETFVLPSHQENFGIAVVEALSCKKPVLISNQINIWREIKTAGGGFVVDDSLEGTLYALETWSNLSVEEKLKMFQQARYSFEKYFSVKSTIKRFLNALDIS